MAEDYEVIHGDDIKCFIPKNQTEIVYKSYSDPNWVKTIHECVDEYQWRIPIFLKDEKTFDGKTCLKYQYMPDIPEDSDSSKYNRYMNEFIDYCRNTYEELEKDNLVEEQHLFMRLHREAFVEFKFEKSQLKYHNLGLNLKTGLVHVRDIDPFYPHTVQIVKSMTELDESLIEFL